MGRCIHLATNFFLSTLELLPSLRPSASELSNECSSDKCHIPVDFFQMVGCHRQTLLIMSFSGILAKIESHGLGVVDASCFRCQTPGISVSSESSGLFHAHVTSHMSWEAFLHLVPFAVCFI